MINKHGKPVIIYGAGLYGQTALEYLLSNGVSVQYIAVSDMADNPLYVHNVAVMAIDKLIHLKEECQVLVAVKKINQQVICEKLDEIGFVNVQCMKDEIFAKWRNWIDNHGFDRSKIIETKEMFYNRRYIEPYLQVLAEVGQRLGDNKTELKNRLLKGRDTISKLNGGICLSRLVVVLGTKCSLRCRDCNNLMSHFRPQSDLRTEVIISSLKKMMGIIKSLGRLELIGGEPFLAGNLKEVLSSVLTLKKVEAIELTTNATILPKDEIIPLLRNERVTVRISDYGTLVDKSRMIACLEEKQVKYEVLDLGKWIAPGGTEKRNRTSAEIKELYNRCVPGYLCKTLYEDKLFACARAASLYTLGYMKEEEYVDFSKDITADELKRFLLRGFSFACDYCDTVIAEPRFVEPAIQLE